MYEARLANALSAHTANYDRRKLASRLAAFHGCVGLYACATMAQPGRTLWCPGAVGARQGRTIAPLAVRACALLRRTRKQQAPAAYA